MKVLGLCFLIYDKINHEELWYNWLRNVDKKKYKIYIHYKNDIKLKFFEKYKLKNCIDTKYADISLVKAQNLLIKSSVNDNCTHQILLSNSCIPLKSFDNVFEYLDNNFSYFNKADDKTCFPRCNKTIKYINKKYIKKYSQWSILNYKHAKLLITEKDYMDWFNYHGTVPDEHCYLTKLFQSKLDSEIIITHNLSSGATTFINWSNMDYPYQKPKKKVKNYNYITTEEIDYLIKQPCLFGRKFNPKCKVIKNKIPSFFYEEIDKYLTKRIC
tara:strand:+ start:4165 stop:4977 length:813 start_codon:yes stop_codon:yes gene_type:complete